MSENSKLTALGRDFWLWRAEQQPRSGDDIPRIERPANWIPRWSAADVARYRLELTTFESRLGEFFTWGEIDLSRPKADWVDAALLHSAFSRVRWELDHLEIWRRQPRFYIDQTIGAVFDYLTPLQVDREVIVDVRRILKSFSATLSDARVNLSGSAFKELAQESIAELAEIERQLNSVGENLASFVESSEANLLIAEFSNAGSELVEFRSWLQAELSNFPHFKAIGEAGFNWFLRNVAFNPITTKELIDIGNLEFERAIFLETVTKNRYSEVPLPPLPESAELQSKDEARLEKEVRAFYESENLLSQPESLGDYLNAPRPKYLEPMTSQVHLGLR